MFEITGNAVEDRLVHLGGVILDPSLQCLRVSLPHQVLLQRVSNEMLMLAQKVPLVIGMPSITCSMVG